jgi:hypothetical protein
VAQEGQRELVTSRRIDANGSACTPSMVWRRVAVGGLDHGVGHSLLLLYDVKAPNGQKSKEFKGLRHYPSNTALSLF